MSCRMLVAFSLAADTAPQTLSHHAQFLAMHLLMLEMLLFLYTMTSKKEGI